MRLSMGDGSQTSNDKSSFNVVGIVTFGVILWVTSQNATGNMRSLINRFLGVLLLSMMLLNWSKIRPIFFK
jgi:hypothetical protein